MGEEENLNLYIPRNTNNNPSSSFPSSSSPSLLLSQFTLLLGEIESSSLSPHIRKLAQDLINKISLEEEEEEDGMDKEEEKKEEKSSEKRMIRKNRKRKQIEINEKQQRQQLKA